MKRRSPEYLKKLERDEILIKFFYCTLARAFILWVESLVVNHEPGRRFYFLLLGINFFEIVIWSGVLEEELTIIWKSLTRPTKFEYQNGITALFICGSIMIKLLLYFGIPYSSSWIITLTAVAPIFVSLTYSEQYCKNIKIHGIETVIAMKLDEYQGIIDDKAQKQLFEPKLTSLWVFLILNALHLVASYYEGLSSQLFIHVQAPFLICKPRLGVYLLVFVLQAIHGFLNYTPMVYFQVALLLMVYKFRHIRERIMAITVSLIVAIIKTVIVKQDIQLVLIFAQFVCSLVYMTLFKMDLVVRQGVVLTKIFVEVITFMGILFFFYEVESSLTKSNFAYIAISCGEIQMILRLTMFLSQYLAKTESLDLLKVMQQDKYVYNSAEILESRINQTFFYSMTFLIPKGYWQITTIMLTMYYSPITVRYFNFSFFLLIKNIFSKTSYILSHIYFFSSSLRYWAHQINISYDSNLVVLCMILGVIFTFLDRYENKMIRRVNVVMTPLWAYVLVFEPCDVTFFTLMVVFSLEKMTQI